VIPLTVCTPWGAQEVCEELEFEIPMMFLLSNLFLYSLHGLSEFGSGLIQIIQQSRRVFSWTRLGLTSDHLDKTGKKLTICLVTRRKVFGFRHVKFPRDGLQVFREVDNDHSEGNVCYLWIKFFAGDYDFCDRVKKHGRKILIVELIRLI